MISFAQLALLGNSSKRIRRPCKIHCAREGCGSCHDGHWLPRRSFAVAPWDPGAAGRGRGGRAAAEREPRRRRQVHFDCGRNVEATRCAVSSAFVVLEHNGTTRRVAVRDSAMRTCRHAESRFSEWSLSLRCATAVSETFETRLCCTETVSCRHVGAGFSDTFEQIRHPVPMDKKQKTSPEPTIVLRGHAGEVQCLAFCSRTRRLFSGRAVLH